MKETENRPGMVVQAARDFETGRGDPVLVYVTGQYGGHALLPYKVTEKDGNYNVACYDGNFPGKERNLVISGDLTSFSYEMFPRKTESTSAGGSIYFIPYESVQKYYNGIEHSGANSNILISSSVSDVRITDSGAVNINNMPNAYRVCGVSGHRPDAYRKRVG